MILFSLPKIQFIERNGIIFQVDRANPSHRFDPVTAMVMVGAGAGITAYSKYEEGKDAQKLANARAAVDIENAKNAKNAANNQAQIEAEKGRKLIARQKSVAAAGGVMINAGSPLAIESQTKQDVSRDVGLIVETGEIQRQQYLNSAKYEKQAGKNAYKQGIWGAAGTGLQGAGSIAFMGADAGYWGGGSKFASQKATTTGMNTSYYTR